MVGNDWDLLLSGKLIMTKAQLAWCESLPNIDATWSADTTNSMWLCQGLLHPIVMSDVTNYKMVGGRCAHRYLACQALPSTLNVGFVLSKLNDKNMATIDLGNKFCDYVALASLE